MGLKSGLLMPLVTLVAVVVGTAGAAYFTWRHAPPVGGEWWPYVRATATIVGGIIGAKIGAAVGVVFGLILMVVGEVLLR